MEEKGESKFHKNGEMGILRYVRESRDKMNTEENVLENSMLYLSILADRMKSFMEDHKVEVTQHFNFQNSNLFGVDLYSAIILSGMFVSACVQVMIIKSYFTGSISWKVWQF